MLDLTYSQLQKSLDVTLKGNSSNLFFFSDDLSFTDNGASHGFLKFCSVSKII